MATEPYFMCQMKLGRIPGGAVHCVGPEEAPSTLEPSGKLDCLPCVLQARADDFT